MEPIEIIYAGFSSLQDYLSFHVLTCLIPAFFIAGAITVFISNTAIFKYFGSKTKKYLSYSVASVSGAVLAVCSCTVLPLFAGIYKRGAGIGPATTFLFSGPAINILAVVLTARILGYELGVARAVGAVLMSIIIGLAMAFIFRNEPRERNPQGFEFSSKPSIRPRWVTGTVFGLLIAILVVGATSTEYIPFVLKISAVVAFIFILLIVLIKQYETKELRQWVLATVNLTKKIFPILLIGVFIVGIIGGVAAFLLPNADPATAVGELAAPYIGGNSLSSCFLASIIGAILYIPTLLEVAIVGDLFGFSSGIMGGGPALALLLAGPSLSLPNMVVIFKVLGMKKTIVFIGLVVFAATTIGFSYGLLMG